MACFIPAKLANSKVIGPQANRTQDDVGSVAAHTANHIFRGYQTMIWLPCSFIS